jgi:hypothetical protein
VALEEDNRRTLVRGGDRGTDAGCTGTYDHHSFSGHHSTTALSSLGCVEPTRAEPSHADDGSR